MCLICIKDRRQTGLMDEIKAVEIYDGLCA